jgi:hypothetical protein
VPRRLLSYVDYDAPSVTRSIVVVFTYPSYGFVRVGVIRLSSSTGGVWVSSTIRGHGIGEAVARPHESFIHTPEPAFVTDTVANLHAEARPSTPLRGEPE